MYAKGWSLYISYRRKTATSCEVGLSNSPHKRNISCKNEMLEKTATSFVSIYERFSDAVVIGFLKGTVEIFSDVVQCPCLCRLVNYQPATLLSQLKNFTGRVCLREDIFNFSRIKKSIEGCRSCSRRHGSSRQIHRTSVASRRATDRIQGKLTFRFGNGGHQ